MYLHLLHCLLSARIGIPLQTWAQILFELISNTLPVLGWACFAQWTDRIVWRSGQTWANAQYFDIFWIVFHKPRPTPLSAPCRGWGVDRERRKERVSHIQLCTGTGQIEKPLEKKAMPNIHCLLLWPDEDHVGPNVLSVLPIDFFAYCNKTCVCPGSSCWEKINFARGTW
jgi:hypothetical protein